ncbi:Rossmann-like and DUF2520 domain-containing protein [Flagellimonas sp. CMM7]|uniref:Rossmann-like and DUF2520 domain-containing protein n=1 Tax=Flagellimonas sp. CMM7 TaxID=2654676 RepID=UPI0013D16386|nr:Rossmann-like and DUF2520 domain-containing protein [Flagellimonas sp. CMM7]UII79805.1 DUF2520 domain-containing protein [Flagellimonas sp. CMM7]
MLSIVIVGTGNVARHLFNAFAESREVKVVQVVGRNKNCLERFSKMCAISNDFAQIATADVYIIAVKDDAIAKVSQSLTSKKGIVVHTSGAVEMDSLESSNRGVFYPLQTFTMGKTLDFKSIPICIEAKQDTAITVLRMLGEAISDKVHEITSAQRKKLHLAAVFANNFTNHLYRISESICLEEGLSFELLQPLILETAQKVQSITPKDAQTGPARRGDKKSIQNHLNLLKDKKQTELYTLFSEAIKKVYEEEL